VEFSEISIIRHPEALKSLLLELRALGCKIGLEHAGLEFIQFEKLQDVGLHYLKIDSAIVRDIDFNTNNHAFVQSLCQLGHSLGITMIAEGVITENEKSTLIKIGVDAFTGPLIC
jgi:EAL domain-containing protein (putative c-di-GMP-specific phosphodiesterase class I)